MSTTLRQDVDFHGLRNSVCTRRIRVVSALGRFGLGRFGQFLGWVVSALVGESFRSNFNGDKR